MICDSPAGMGGLALAIEGALCSAPPKTIVRCYSSECAKRTLHVCLKSSGCHRPSAAKLGAGAVDTGGITRLAVSFDLVDVAPNSLPPLDLPRVLLRHAPHVVTAVPLELRAQAALGTAVQSRRSVHAGHNNTLALSWPSL
jgi:hypothetical protein